jgi:hypothetical protein
MTIDEITNTLPNGFHDSEILSINIDYQRAEATFLIDVDLCSPDEEVEVAVRQGEMKIEGLLYIGIEPPAPRAFSKEYVFDPHKLWISADSSNFSVLKQHPELPEPLPDGGFRHWFFDSNNNSFIYVAGMTASFRWSDNSGT